jgi:glycosyltransferase involved in cell wall biosynthesis
MHITQQTWSDHETTRRRHFCIVTETYPPELNGVALTLARLVDGLRLQGHGVSVVRPRQPIRDTGESSDHKLETLVPGLPLAGYRGLRFGLPSGERLRRRWSVCRPDAVYVATEGPLGWSAIQAARRMKIPVFSGFHTNFDRYAKHYHAGWLRPFVAAYLRSFHNRTNGTLVGSPDLRDRLQAMGIANVGVLGRGVDSRMFNPGRRSAEIRRMWRATDHDHIALYVGRIAPEKNLTLAIDAYRAMQQVNRRVKFVVVGDGPLRATLQAKNSDLIFCGVHTGTELAKRYASADIFLFPSETETFGNVTLEAMASGLVVVAFNYAAARTHIAHGRTGVLVPNGNSQAFVEAAIKVVGETSSLVAMRRQARAYAASLDWRIVIEKFAALLSGALDEGRGVGAALATNEFEAAPVSS